MWPTLSVRESVSSTPGKLEQVFASVRRRFFPGVGSQTATTTYAYPRCGRSAEDGSSRVPLPSGRTPRPLAVRVPRGPRSTPPTVRAGPTPTVAGCSRAAPERSLPKGSHLGARNPGAPPIRPDPTTLRLRPDSPACFASATPSPAPRPPSALRSRRWTTSQVQDAGSTPRARHRADAIRAAMGWLVGPRWAPHRQDSLGLEFGTLRTSLPLSLSVDRVCVKRRREEKVIPEECGVSALVHATLGATAPRFSGRSANRTLPITMKMTTSVKPLWTPCIRASTV